MTISCKKLLPFVVAFAGLTCGDLGAAENSSLISAAQLASRLAALQADGSSYVRLRMQINGATKETLQLQIKSRRTPENSEIVYQVLWPAARKGEAVLLREVGNHAPTGAIFNPTDGVHPLRDLREPLFGSDLACTDPIEDFFAWKEQTIVGAEDVTGVKCQILESKPGKGDHSIYGSVRSWIDLQRLVPMRVEKYSSSGQMVRRIETTRVVSDGARHIPADLVVHGGRAESSTVLAGSRISHDVSYTDADFSENGIREVKPPPHGGE